MGEKADPLKEDPLPVLMMFASCQGSLYKLNWNRIIHEREHLFQIWKSRSRKKERKKKVNSQILYKVRVAQIVEQVVQVCGAEVWKKFFKQIFCVYSREWGD